MNRKSRSLLKVLSFTIPSYWTAVFRMITAKSKVFCILHPLSLQARGINEAQAVDLWAQLYIFGKHWDSPEMDIYDDYDTVKANL